MTRSRDSVYRDVQRAARRLEAEGRIAKTVLSTPQSFRARTPGTVLHRVRQTPETPSREEAEQKFAHQPWAAQARYLHLSGGYFCWERPA